jgi:hypothetical protein
MGLKGFPLPLLVLGAMTWPDVEPDVGLHWFGPNNVCAKSGYPREENPYFDPSKPSVIYVHGFSRRTTARYALALGVYHGCPWPLRIILTTTIRHHHHHHHHHHNRYDVKDAG